MHVKYTKIQCMATKTHKPDFFFEKIMSTSQKLRFCTVFLLLDQYDVIKNGYTLYRHVSDTLKHL